MFVPPRFDVYREVSNEIHAIFKGYTPLVEPLSLDEAYLDVTDNLKGIPTAWETAKEIRARIYEETKLAASAGISCNKFLAKLASDYRKPNGQFAIMPGQGEAFVATLPVAKFRGVGPKTTAKMRTLGIETGSDLRRQTLDFLQDRFGKAGHWYYDIARGRDERPVEADRERKSLGSETTSSEDRTDPVQIEASVIAMADDVWAWCEKTNARGRTVTVKIKWADFQLSTRSRSMESAIQTRHGLHEVVLNLIRSVFPPPKGVRLVGVRPSRTFNRNPAVKRLNCLFVKCNRRYRPAPRPLAPTKGRKSDSKIAPDAALTARPKRKLKRGRNSSPIFGPTMPTHPSTTSPQPAPLYAHVLSATLLKTLHFRFAQIADIPGRLGERAKSDPKATFPIGSGERAGCARKRSSAEGGVAPGAGSQ